jgi:hypothetical protein
MDDEDTCLCIYMCIVDLIENTQICYETDSVLLAICMVAVAVKVMFKYCSRFFGCKSNPIPSPFFIYIVNLIDRLCGLVVRVLGYRSGGPSSIPGTTRKKK